MKKIFSIISIALTGLIVVFICSLCFITTNVSIKSNRPKFIHVFNRSTTSTIMNGYTEDNDKYSKILNNLNKVTKVSVFNRLVNKASLKKEIEIDIDGNKRKWSTDLKKEYIVVELVYDRQQDVVVYYKGDSRVISYFCLSYVIPANNEFSDVVVYYATTNNDATKDESYASCIPLVLKGKAGKFVNFVNGL